jgi:hypothetical protein
MKERKRRKLSLLERFGDLVGKGDSGIPDLATNPKYMEGFGQDGARSRPVLKPKDR